MRTGHGFPVPSEASQYNSGLSNSGKAIAITSAAVFLFCLAVALDSLIYPFGSCSGAIRFCCFRIAWLGSKNSSVRSGTEQALFWLPGIFTSHDFITST